MIDESPKGMREALCAAQSAITEHYIMSGTAHNAGTWIDQIQAIINLIDRHRPLDADGVHGDAHTDTCGCDESNAGPWTLTFGNGLHVNGKRVRGA